LTIAAHLNNKGMIPPQAHGCGVKGVSTLNIHPFHGALKQSI
jgi:hypothetical protein